MSNATFMGAVIATLFGVLVGWMIGDMIFSPGTNYTLILTMSADHSGVALAQVQLSFDGYISCANAGKEWEETVEWISFPDRELRTAWACVKQE